MINIQEDNQLLESLRDVDADAKPITNHIKSTFINAFQRAVEFKSHRIDRGEIRNIRYKIEDKLKSVARWIYVDLYPHYSGFKYKTNLATIFKTKKGTIYGHSTDYLRPLFYTSHCLERFLTRVRPTAYTAVSRQFLKNLGRRPAPHEVLDAIITSRVPYLQFGLTKTRDVLLNTLLGTLVLESYKSTYIAKTFLKQNQVYDATWYVVEQMPWEEECIIYEDLKDLLCHNAKPCIPLHVSSIPYF